MILYLTSKLLSLTNLAPSKLNKLFDKAVPAPAFIDLSASENFVYTDNFESIQFCKFFTNFDVIPLLDVISNHPNPLILFKTISLLGDD